MRKCYICGGEPVILIRRAEPSERQHGQYFALMQCERCGHCVSRYDDSIAQAATAIEQQWTGILEGVILREA